MSSPDDAAARSQELKGRSTRGGAVAVVMQAGQVIVGTLSTILLARLLSPAAFGVFFMATVMTELTSSIRDQGVPHAVARAPDLGERSLVALFWRQVRFNVGLSALIAASGPALAVFFDEPVLVVLAIVLAVGLALDGMTSVHLGLLRRRLAFVSEAWIDGTALFVSIGAAVVAALAGLGVWALAVQHVTKHLVHGVGVLVGSPWLPGRPSAGKGADVDLVKRYGKSLSGARLLAHVARNIDRVVIGRIAGDVALGLYQSAYRWSVLPVRQLTTPLLSVVMTSLARVTGDATRYRNWFGTALLGVSTLAMPVLAYAGATAPTLVRAFLGPQWLDATPLLRVLLPAAAAALLSAALKWAYYAEGHTDRQLRWTQISVVVTVAAVAVGAYLGGAMGVAVAWSGVTVALSVPEVRWCLVGSPLQPRDVWLPFGRPLVSALAGVLASVLVLGTSPAGVPAMSASLVIVFGVYAATFRLLPGGALAVLRLRRAVDLVRPRARRGGDHVVADR